MARLSNAQIYGYCVESGWTSQLGTPRWIQVHQGGKVTTDAKGFRKAVSIADTLIAICLAESGGDPLAKNTSSSARGLWQIMTSLHGDIIDQEVANVFAQLREKNPNARVPTIFHPLVNTQVAKRLSYGAGKANPFKPWEAYNSGAYKRHTGHGEAAVLAWFRKAYSPEAVSAGIAQLEAEHALGVAVAEFAGLAVPGGVLLGNDLVQNPIDTVLSFVKEMGISIGVFILAAVLIVVGIVVLNRRAIGKIVP